ncbi:MAG TPA: tripartite tricarboxylate transporter substrate binding protein [Casimicrobiaceae bacterium]
MTASRLICTLVLALAAVGARAQYPDHPIKAIVPFPAGGGTDVFARLVSDRLGKAIGQPVVIDNRAGADGNIGMEAAAKSPGDGYTMLFNSSAATVNPVMYRHLRFDPVRELKPVAVLCEYYNLIVVNVEKVPAKTLGEFIALMKREPGKYNFGSNGARLGIELFKQATGVEVTVIPYKGASDAITGLLRGDADFMIVNAPGLLPHIASGKLRALASTGPKREPDLPDVPTTAEAGVPQYTYASFFGAYVPAATPAEIVRRLNGALNGITAMPDVVAQFRSNGATAVQSTPEDAMRRYESDIAKFRDAVERGKIPPVD